MAKLRSLGAAAFGLVLVQACSVDGSRHRPQAESATIDDSLWDARSVERDPGLPAWSWPRPEDFAAAAAVERMPRAQWRATARYSSGGATPTYDVVLRNDEAVAGAVGLPRSRIVAARAHDPRDDVYGTALVGAVGPLVQSMTPGEPSVFFGYREPLVGPAVREPSPPTPAAARALYAYVGALLGDLPEDVARAEEEALRDRAEQVGALGVLLRQRLRSIAGTRGAPYSADLALAVAPRAAPLLRTPIDVPAFFAGAVLRFDGPGAHGVEVPPRCLGAAAAGFPTALRERIAREWRALAEDEALDPLNRLNAAEALYAVAASAEDGRPVVRGGKEFAREAVAREVLEGLRLSDAARVRFGFR